MTNCTRVSQRCVPFSPLARVGKSLPRSENWGPGDSSPVRRVLTGEGVGALGVEVEVRPLFAVVPWRVVLPCGESCTTERRVILASC